jgi:hypothetical protein
LSPISITTQGLWNVRFIDHKKWHGMLSSNRF